MQPMQCVTDCWMLQSFTGVENCCDAKKCWARIRVIHVTTSNQWETCWCFWHRQAGLVKTIHENRQFGQIPPILWTKILSSSCWANKDTPSVCPKHQSINPLIFIPWSKQFRCGKPKRFPVREMIYIHDGFSSISLYQRFQEVLPNSERLCSRHESHLNIFFPP